MAGPRAPAPRGADRRCRRGAPRSRRSSADGLLRPHLDGVDLLERRAVVVPGSLALGRVLGRNRHVRRGAELLRDRHRPLGQRLEPRPRRHGLGAREVDQLAREPEPDRAPEVLLDQAARRIRQWLAVVARAGDAHSQRVRERCERLRLGELRLGVADPNLDRRKGQVWAHAPPELRVLGDRAGRVEEAHVVLELAPAGEDVGDPAAGEHPREDLRPRRVEPGVDALDERRAGREGEQVGQERAERVADGDRAVGSLDRHVDVQAEAGVPPDDVLEDLVVPLVVRRVDDPLVLPPAPRVRARAAEADPELARELRELAAPLAHAGRTVRERLAAPGLDLDLGRDQLADEVLLEHGPLRRGLELLEPADEVEGRRIEERELLLDRDREVGRRLEALPGETDLLVRGESLFVAHGRTTVVEGLERAGTVPAVRTSHVRAGRWGLSPYGTAARSRAATLAQLQRASTARRAARARSDRSSGASASKRSSFARRSSTSPVSKLARSRKAAGYS